MLLVCSSVNGFWCKSLKNMHLIKVEVLKAATPLGEMSLILLYNLFLFRGAPKIFRTFLDLTFFITFFYAGEHKEETPPRDGNGGVAGEKLFYICICLYFVCIFH